MSVFELFRSDCITVYIDYSIVREPEIIASYVVIIFTSVLIYKVILLLEWIRDKGRHVKKKNISGRAPSFCKLQKVHNRCKGSFTERCQE